MIQFKVHLKSKTHTINTEETEVVKNFLKSWPNKIPYGQWVKCCHENNIKSEIKEDK